MSVSGVQDYFIMVLNQICINPLFKFYVMCMRRYEGMHLRLHYFPYLLYARDDSSSESEHMRRLGRALSFRYLMWWLILPICNNLNDHIHPNKYI